VIRKSTLAEASASVSAGAGALAFVFENIGTTVQPLRASKIAAVSRSRLTALI